MSDGKLRALLLEDEWTARNYLAELLQSSGLVDIVGAVGSAAQASEALDHLWPGIDAVFVDVNLTGSEGDAAGLSFIRAHQEKKGLQFVLATAYEHHALAGFELGVIDYVLKPFTEERIGKCLAKLQQRVPPRVSTRPLRIVARRKAGLVFLELTEVWAFEAAGRLTFVHADSGRFDLDVSLTTIEASFGVALLRVHRNWLVNAARARGLERDGTDTEILLGAALDSDRQLRVPVARERTAAVRESLLASAMGIRKGNV